MNAGPAYHAQPAAMMPSQAHSAMVLPQPIPHENIQLSIPQQPQRGKVVSAGKERDRKPIDPPPIIRIAIENDYNQAGCSALNNPYIFCSVSLWDDVEDKPKQPTDSAGDSPDSSSQRNKRALYGTTVSSLHRLKDHDNKDGGFFVFGDVSAGCTGPVRLKFTVWEFVPRAGAGRAQMLKEILSSRFEIGSAKEWDGIKESTSLSRSFADQGVRLRLRKESRAQSTKRTFQTFSQSQAQRIAAAPVMPPQQDLMQRQMQPSHNLPRPDMYSGNSMISSRPMAFDSALSLPALQTSAVGGPAYATEPSRGSPYEVQEHISKRPRSNTAVHGYPSGLYTPPNSTYSTTMYPNQYYPGGPSTYQTPPPQNGYSAYPPQTTAATQASPQHQQHQPPPPPPPQQHQDSQQQHHPAGAPHQMYSGSAYSYEPQPSYYRTPQAPES